MCSLCDGGVGVIECTDETAEGVRQRRHDQLIVLDGVRSD